MKILLTGATGLIGSHLAELLESKGFEVAILTRGVGAGCKYDSYLWNPVTGTIDENAFKEVDYVVHLAGTNIMAKRWTDQRKAEIITSRTLSTKLLVKTIKTNKIPLKGFISASAIGYYGSFTSDKVFEEDSPAHSDFLSESCRLWEAASDSLNDLDIRKVHIRIGVVLAKQGGALEQLVRPVALGLGAALGSGKQYMPWVHIDDLSNMFLETIENSKLEGAYNGVAPESATNNAFTKQLAKTLNKPFWLPNVPSFIIKLLLGEMSTVVLDGSRVWAHKIISTGFRFKYNTLREALKDLLQ